MKIMFGRLASRLDYHKHELRIFKERDEKILGNDLT